VKLTRGAREVDDVSDCGDKNRCTFLEKPSGVGSESACLLGQLDRMLDILHSEAGVKEEKSVDQTSE